MRRSGLVLAVLIGLTTLAACGDDATDNAASTTTTTTTTTAVDRAELPTTEPDSDDGRLVVLVTNDDGVGAPGIDAVVEALRARPELEIEVVAPLENQSGSSDKTTPGATPTAVDAETASGFAAHAVAGFPADAVTAAFVELGIEPDLVISGINQGQNIGPLAELSGTVGAARSAARRGVPAIAVSAGIGDEVDYAAAVAQLLAVLDAQLDELLDGGPVALNLNVPTCTAGMVRGLVEVPMATEDRGLGIDSDCTSTAGPEFDDDVEAFVNGYAALADAGFLTSCPGPGSGHPVEVLDGQLDHQPFVGDHRRPVLVPVVVLARDRTVVLDQGIHRRVVGGRGRRHETGVPLDHRVRVEVVTGDVETGPGIAPQVRGLGPAVGHRDADHVVVSQHVRHVRQLRSAVFLEGDEDPMVLAGDERTERVGVHVNVNHVRTPVIPEVCAQANDRRRASRSSRQARTTKNWATAEPGDGRPAGGAVVEADHQAGDDGERTERNRHAHDRPGRGGRAATRWPAGRRGARTRAGCRWPGSWPRC